MCSVFVIFVILTFLLTRLAAVVSRTGAIINNKAFKLDLDKSHHSYDLGEAGFDFAFRVKDDMPPEIGHFTLN